MSTGECVRDDLLARVEALFLSAEESISLRGLTKVVGFASEKEAAHAIETLNKMYKQDNSAFCLVPSAGGWQLLTRPELAPWLETWKAEQQNKPLSRSALEVLAIIAHCQPMTRADVDALRGVSSAEILKDLLEAGWIKVAGVEETLGRPKLYATTRAFLQEFGLNALGDLPASEHRTPDSSLEEPDEVSDED